MEYVVVSLQKGDKLLSLKDKPAKLYLTMDKQNAQDLADRLNGGTGKQYSHEWVLAKVIDNKFTGK